MTVVRGAVGDLSVDVCHIFMDTVCRKIHECLLAVPESDCEMATQEIPPSPFNLRSHILGAQR